MGVSDSQKPLPMLFPQLDRLLRLPSSRPLSSPSSSGATRLLTKQFFQLLKKEKQKKHLSKKTQHCLVKNENNNNIKFNLYMDLITTSTEVVLDSLEDTAMSATDP